MLVQVMYFMYYQLIKTVSKVGKGYLNNKIHKKMHLNVVLRKAVLC